MTPNELVREEADFIEIQRRKELRDHFAGLAMQALIALRLQLPISAECHEAYRYADEMLRAREAGQ